MDASDSRNREPDYFRRHQLHQNFISDVILESDFFASSFDLQQPRIFFTSWVIQGWKIYFGISWAFFIAKLLGHVDDIAL